jgi:hypothetical protein
VLKSLAYQSGHGAADWTDCQRLTHFSSQGPLVHGVEKQQILPVLQVALSNDGHHPGVCVQ